MVHEDLDVPWTRLMECGQCARVTWHVLVSRHGDEVWQCKQCRTWGMTENTRLCHEACDKDD